MIEKNKQYETRDGREVRIYATDGEGDQPIHGAIKLPGGWRSDTWRKDGRFRFDSDVDSPFDLIEVKPRIKRTVWVNVYPDDFNTFWETKERAYRHQKPDGSRLACVKVEIDCEEGEGL